jgi:hypothetical protein
VRRHTVPHPAHTVDSSPRNNAASCGGNWSDTQARSCAVGMRPRMVCTCEGSPGDSSETCRHTHEGQQHCIGAEPRGDAATWRFSHDARPHTHWYSSNNPDTDEQGTAAPPGVTGETLPDFLVTWRMESSSLCVAGCACWGIKGLILWGQHKTIHGVMGDTPQLMHMAWPLLVQAMTTRPACTSSLSFMPLFAGIPPLLPFPQHHMVRRQRALPFLDPPYKRMPGRKATSRC